MAQIDATLILWHTLQLCKDATAICQMEQRLNSLGLTDGYCLHYTAH